MIIFEIFKKIGDFFFNKKIMFLAYTFYRICACDNSLRKYCIIGLTNIYEYNKEYEKGIKLLKKEIKRSGNGDYDINFQLAYFNFLNGNSHKAKKIYEYLLNKFVLLHKDIDYQLIGNLIYLYNESKEYNNAVKLIENFIENRQLNNVKNYIFYNIGNTYMSLEQYEKAIKYYYKALDKKYDKKTHVLYNIGLCYYKTGEYDKAIHFIEQSLRLAKEKKEIGELKYALGCVYEKKGDIIKARKYFIDALKYGYNKAEEALKELS